MQTVTQKRSFYRDWTTACRQRWELIVRDSWLLCCNSPSSGGVSKSLDTLEFNAQHSAQTTVRFTSLRYVKGALRQIWARSSVNLSRGVGFRLWKQFCDVFWGSEGSFINSEKRTLVVPSGLSFFAWDQTRQNGHRKPSYRKLFGLSEIVEQKFLLRWLRCRTTNGLPLVKGNARAHPHGLYRWAVMTRDALSVKRVSDNTVYMWEQYLTSFCN